MDIFKGTEKLMAMDDHVWMRHANPWSVWTRVATAVPLFFALYSPWWIGWYALIPIVLVCIWIWLNPRLFSEPKNKNNWASKGVFGERVYLNRKNIPVPKHHDWAAQILTALSGIFFVIFAIAVIFNEFTHALWAFTATTIFKVWFVDRMAWLYDDMHKDNPEYEQWMK